MLKIKDGVDLKKLEKFGFKFINHNIEKLNSYSEYMWIKNCIMECYEDSIGITNDRYIKITTYPEYLDIDNYAYKIYELLKANLVEKVEGKI